MILILNMKIKLNKNKYYKHLKVILINNWKKLPNESNEKGNDIKGAYLKYLLKFLIKICC